MELETAQTELEKYLAARVYCLTQRVAWLEKRVTEQAEMIEDLHDDLENMNKGGTE